jgi:hypothetical protein
MPRLGMRVYVTAVTLLVCSVLAKAFKRRGGPKPNMPLGRKAGK